MKRWNFNNSRIHSFKKTRSQMLNITKLWLFQWWDLPNEGVSIEIFPHVYSLGVHFSLPPYSWNQQKHSSRHKAVNSLEIRGNVWQTWVYPIEYTQFQTVKRRCFPRLLVPPPPLEYRGPKSDRNRQQLWIIFQQNDVSPLIELISIAVFWCGNFLLPTLFNECVRQNFKVIVWHFFAY